MPDKPARKAPAPGAQRWERLVAASESRVSVEAETIASEEETDEEAETMASEAESDEEHPGREEARPVAGAKGARQRAASRSDSSSSSSSDDDDSGDDEEEEPRARQAREAAAEAAGMRPRRGTREYGGGRAGSPTAGRTRVRAGWRCQVDVAEHRSCLCRWLCGGGSGRNSRSIRSGKRSGACPEL